MPVLIGYCLSFFWVSGTGFIPEPPWLTTVPLVLAVLIIYQAAQKQLMKKIAQVILGFLSGYGLCYVAVVTQKASMLPADKEHAVITFNVSVASLIKETSYGRSFTAKVLPEKTDALESLPLKKVLLREYFSKKKPELKSIQPCDKLQVKVLLKRPRGLVNYAGFDYERYLFEQHIDAVGTIQSIDHVQADKAFCIDQVRQSFKTYLEDLLPISQAKWLLALTIGERTGFTQADRTFLADTGLSHLFVISGLHMGVVASMVFWLILLLRRIGGGLFLSGDWRGAAALIAIGVTFFYAGFAGFGYSTQRAWIAVTSFMLLSRTPWMLTLWQRYFLTLALTLTISPLAPLNGGFLLSFYAVFFILLIVDKPILKKRSLQNLLAYVQIQWVLALGLLPLSLLLFQQVSLIGPFLNIWMIPVVSTVIVPGILLCLGVWLLGVPTAWLWEGLGWLIDALLSVVDHCIALWPWSLVHYQGVSISWICIWSVSVIVLCQRFIKGTAFPACGLLALLLMTARSDQHPVSRLTMDVLDVGQGTALVIRLDDKVLLYDTGRSWPSGSMGQRVIIPFLRHAGIDNIDKIIISHGDNDHIGGLADVMKAYKVDDLISAKTIDDRTINCRDHEDWAWGDAHFSIIHPSSDEALSENNQSCVLLVRYQGRSLLLAGDVEAQIEHELIRHHDLSTIDLLLVPHHGSKTSSSWPFVNRLRPKWAIVSNGYQNRYGHPHHKVVQRYKSIGSEVVSTAKFGAIRAMIDKHGRVELVTLRHSPSYFWRAP